MKCPRCGLLNPPTAERCDCGFDFGSHRDSSTMTTSIKKVEWPRVIGRYLWSLVAWEIAVILPLAIVFVHAGIPVSPEDRAEDLKFLSVVVLYGIPVVAVCSWVAPRVKGMNSVLFSFFVGFLCAVFGAFLWASITSGFEGQPAIFVSCLFLSIPSGVGGGFACWLYQRGLHSSSR